MPWVRRPEPPRPLAACLLAACTWTLPAWGDPVELPALGLRPEGAEYSAIPPIGTSTGTPTAPGQGLEEQGLEEQGLGGSMTSVPPTPVPRFELNDPLAPTPSARAVAVPSATLHPSWLPQETDSPRGPPPQGARPWDANASWDAPPGPHLSPLSPLDGYVPPPAPLGSSSTSSLQALVIDDRSGWARWNANLWGVTATVLAFDVVMVIGFTFLPSDVTGWGEPRFNGLKKNLTVGPRVDNDRFLFNYVAHPLAGSEYYLIGRNRGLNWWQSTAYSVALSTAFEFLIESAYEQASWQDLWITPVAGTVFGELRWQVKKALENPSTGRPVGTLNKILYVVIDPFDAVYKL